MHIKCVCSTVVLGSIIVYQYFVLKELKKNKIEEDTPSLEMESMFSDISLTHVEELDRYRGLFDF